jgi:hypothetical protein
MAKRKRDDWEDDGRVIANMDVDGMPYTFRRGKRRNYDAFGKVKQKSDPIDLTRKEKPSQSPGARLPPIMLVLVYSSLYLGCFCCLPAKFGSINKYEESRFQETAFLCGIFNP